MGRLKKTRKTPLFTPLQRKIFEHIAKEKKIFSKFYFTGGTALSAFYLRHRESEDLDFFSEKDFENERIQEYMSDLAGKLGFQYQFTQRYRARIYEFVKNDTFLIKVDFVYHPYTSVEKGITYKSIVIDSLRDIAINKLLTINQRTEVKDFVDLYFLLKEFTIWDLIYGVEAKYRMKLDRILIALDFMKVEAFTFLPNMIVPLTLLQVKKFFREKAREIGKRVVE